jgi:DNA adenine methylase
MSPLRFPGSKVRITEMVAGLLERNLLVGSHLYEPFAGGSAVSLGLLANGFVPKATWVERDPMIYAFWTMVKDRPEAAGVGGLELRYPGASHVFEILQ